MAVDEGLKSELQKQGIFVTKVNELYNWGRRSSIWPMQFGLACCAIEMIATACARYDIARFGAELFRPSPRQADLMIVSGTVTKKMAPMVVRLYNQMPDPKYVITMGACSISGGPFRDGYNVLKGIDRYIPVDVHIPGCPPRPEALLHGLMKLQEKIDGQTFSTMNEYNKSKTEEYAIPEYGPHGLLPKYNADIFKPRQDWPEENTKDFLRNPNYVKPEPKPAPAPRPAATTATETTTAPRPTITAKPTETPAVPKAEDSKTNPPTDGEKQ